MKKKLIERELNVELNLFDNIEDVISSLQKIKDDHPNLKLTVDDHWTGYEDVEYRVVYYSEETDKEYNSRLESERRAKERAEQQKIADKKREKELEQLRHLQSKYGRYA